jgi:hypothetical protein
VIVAAFVFVRLDVVVPLFREATCLPRRALAAPSIFGAARRALRKIE